MATLEAIQPYVEQLFDDSDVRKQLGRASANLRAARVRAGKAKSKKKALKDPALHQRLAASVRAMIAAGAAIDKAPEKQRRRSRLKALLALAVVGGGAYLALDEQARAYVLGLVRSDAPAPAAPEPVRS
jgi:hypothetical protein